MPLTPLLLGDPGALGPYRLLGRLGQGGMGTVFLGLGDDERAVAVKVLREGPADLDGRQRFRRELEALQRVRGAHLVDVLGGDVEAETPWIVTRFVPGRRLDEEVDGGGPLDEPGVRRLADGLAEGLHALHRAGVVHRDLTPGNVLMVDGEPQVIDLGLAVVTDVTGLTRTGVLLGTAGYLAPEQVLGHATTPAVDVHAWGAVVAYAATGRPPYGTGRPDAVLYRVVHEAPDLDGVPRALRPLVGAALDKDPARRPRPKELGAALAALPGPQPTSGPVRTGLPTGAPALTALLGPQAPEVLEGALGSAGAAGPPETTRLETTRLETTRPETTRLDAPRPAAHPAAARLDGPTDALPVAAGAPARTTRLDAAATAALPVAPPPRRPDHPVAPAGTPYDAEPAPAREPGSVPYRPHDDDPWGPPPEPEGPRRTWQWLLLAAVALAVLGAAALSAPLAVAAAALAGLLVVQTAGRARAARALRHDRRGARRSDGLVTTVALPWHLVRAALDLLLALPLALAVAVPLALLLDGTAASPEPEAVAAAGALVVAVVLLLVPRRWRPSRLLLRRAATGLPPGTALLVALGAAGVALGLLAVAGASAAAWWPLAEAP